MNIATLQSIRAALRLTTRTGRAEAASHGMAVSSLRRWGRNDNFPTVRSLPGLLNLAIRLSGAHGVNLNVDGEELLVMRRADLEALLAAPAHRPRLTHRQLIALAQRRN